jgi:hypothetical protein
MPKSPARPAVSLDEALALLRAQARPEALAGMAGFGMGTEGRLGLSMPICRPS